MSPSRWIRPLAVGALLAAGAFGSQSALAYGGGGHHGGFSRSGGGFSHSGAGFSRGGGTYSRGSSGFRGGYVGGGYSRGYAGYGGGRHYYGGGGFSPFWGVLGLGLFVATLPYYYSTYYWNGYPYYYADGYYYRYDDSVRQYERVTLPTATTTQAAPPSAELFAYPKNGQSEAQQAQDKAECRDWAGRQESSSSAPADAQPVAQQPLSQADALRAQTACLEGRGYTVR